MTLSTSPIMLSDASFEWHRKPSGRRSQCPLCGLPARFNGLHRRVRPEESTRHTFIVAATARHEEIKVSSYSPKGRKINREPSGPEPETMALLSKVATLMATGKTEKQAAEAVGRNVGQLRDWQRRHRELWATVYDRAMANVLRVVRAQAGTSAIVDNPEQFLQMAASAERLAPASMTNRCFLRATPIRWRISSSRSIAPPAWLCEPQHDQPLSDRP